MYAGIHRIFQLVVRLNMKRLFSLLFISLLLSSSAYAEPLLKLSTTTSTDNTGLLGVLNKAFSE
jgi:tungstate transport system substrate-binding protein